MVVIDPVRDHSEGMVAVLEVVPPDALRLEAAEEALDHSVLLPDVLGDVLLVEPVAALRDRHKVFARNMRRFRR